MASRYKALSGMSHGETERFVLANRVRQKGIWDWTVLDGRLEDAASPSAFAPLSAPLAPVEGAEGEAREASVPALSASSSSSSFASPPPAVAVASALLAGSAEVPASAARAAVATPVAAVSAVPAAAAAEATAVVAAAAEVAASPTPALAFVAAHPGPAAVDAILGGLTQVSPHADADGDLSMEDEDEPWQPLAPPSPPQLGGPLAAQHDAYEEEEEDEEDVDEDHPAPPPRRRFEPRLPGSRPQSAGPTKWVPPVVPKRPSAEAEKEQQKCRHLRTTTPSASGSSLVCADCGEALRYDGWRLEYTAYGKIPIKGISADQASRTSFSQFVDPDDKQWPCIARWAVSWRLASRLGQPGVKPERASPQFEI